MEHLIDGHCHYTGSLSDKFFQSKKNIPRNVLHLTSKNDWVENYEKYFEIYKKRQELCRYSIQEMAKESYRLGAIDIASGYFREGVDQFQLRIGPKSSIVETKNRLDSMNKGFETVEKKYKLNNFAKIILTFIQDKNGYFVNYCDEVLDYIFKQIYDKRDLTQRVIGFDFSGPENSRNWVAIQSVIRKINKFNYTLNTKKGIRLETMVHAGEFVDAEKYEETIEQIKNLISLKINRISHGTILWIPAVYINKEEKEKIDIKQIEMLKLISKNKIILEICPSANFLISPLESINQIPLAKFSNLGVNFTINTDSKGIYKTTLKKEYSLLSK